MIKIKLQNLLKEHRMTQAELAGATGIRPSTICDMYNNNCTFLKLENIDRICTYLNCTLNDIIEIYPIIEEGYNK